MAIAFTQLAWWLSSVKHKEPRIPYGSSLNPSPDSMWESDNLKFPLSRKKPTPSSRNIKRQWRSREERKMDKEYDIVLVPSDGGCISGSESDDSDWSIGWLEPHGAGFQSDDESDDSFAVLVPCYGRVCEDMMGEAESKITVDAVGVIADILPAESKKSPEQLMTHCDPNFPVDKNPRRSLARFTKLVSSISLWLDKFVEDKKKTFEKRRRKSPCL